MDTLTAEHAATAELGINLDSILSALNFPKYPTWPDEQSRKQKRFSEDDLLRLMAHYLDVIEHDPDLLTFVKSITGEARGEDHKLEGVDDLGKIILKYVAAKNGSPSHLSCFVDVTSEKDTFWGYYELGSVAHKGYHLRICVALLEYYRDGPSSECVIGVRFMPDIGEPSIHGGLYQMPHVDCVNQVTDLRKRITADLAGKGTLPPSNTEPLAVILGSPPYLDGLNRVRYQ